MTTAFFTIREGELVHKSTIKKTFEGLKDGHYELSITKRNKRSLQQSRYYFGVCVKMVREGLKDMGNDVSIQKTHEWLNAKFNYLELINEQTGEIERIPKSTTDLNKEDFSKYISDIQQFAVEFLNIIIPDPGQQMMIDYE